MAFAILRLRSAEANLLNALSLPGMIDDPTGPLGEETGGDPSLPYLLAADGPCGTGQPECCCMLHNFNTPGGVAMMQRVGPYAEYSREKPSGTWRAFLLHSPRVASRTSGTAAHQFWAGPYPSMISTALPIYPVSTRGRVLLVAPQPFYEDRGTPIAVLQVLEALSELGYEVDVLTYPVGREVNIPGVRFFRLQNPFRIRRVPIGFSMRKVVLDALLLPNLFRLLRNNRYDCIHAVEESAFPAVLLGRKFRLPVIYDMQSSLPEQMMKYRLFRNRPVQSMLRNFEEWLLGEADHIVSSAGLAQQVRSLQPNSHIREWSYFSEHTAASPPDVDELRSALQIPTGSRVVLYTGTFEEYQGLPTLIDAMPQIRREVPGTVFVLVGGTGPEEAAVRRQARELGLNGSVRVISRQSRERIPTFLAMADVLVSPRAYGGNLPLKIFDYLASGRPIVATDIPTHRSVLDEERALLVRAEPQALARGVSELLQNPARADALAEAARAFARSRFGRVKFTQEIEQLYSQVCEPSGGKVG